MTVAEQKAIIKAELAIATVASTDEDFPRQLFPDPGDDEIDAYLKATPLYDTESGRWVKLPKDVNCEEKLINIPMSEILGEILESFDLSAPNPGNRVVWDLTTKKSQRLAHEKEMAAKEKEEKDRVAREKQARPKSTKEKVELATDEGGDNGLDGKAEAATGKGQEDGAKETKRAKTFPKAMHHSEAVPTKAYSIPDTVFTGTGPGFTIDDVDMERPLYRASLGVVDYKRDSELDGSITENTAQLGVYARQVMNHQPNRNFVRAANVSNERVRLFHFDRSGVKYSLLYNIHSNPRMFVRIILGLVSTNLADLGFDPSIVWEPTDDPAAKFKRGTLTTRTANNDAIVYDIVGVEPFYRRRDLVGRGTLCWSIEIRTASNRDQTEARNPDGQVEALFEKEGSAERDADVVEGEGRKSESEAADNGLSSKESWCSESRTSEEVFLAAAVGVKGVGQMVACEDVVETASFRGANAINDPGFLNRIKRRIILKKYGPPIHKFKTVLDVLYALIDAIRAHQRMVKEKGVLHRDISVNNILLGIAGADSEEGWRGVLIDFDMAIFLDRAEALLNELRTGTRMFQSLNVLQAWRPHDYLDDLESFLYVLIYLVLAFPEPNVECELPKELQDWNADSLYEAYKSKLTFITHGVLNFDVPPMWGYHISTLVEDLCRHFQPIHAMSIRISNQRLPKAQRDKLEASFKKKYLNDVDGQYDEIVGYIESAIENILAGQDGANEPSTMSSPSPTPAPRKGAGKRGSEEAYPHDAKEPSMKRSRH
ncbi:other/FunK1 protein kinase [Coprinopsis cinerea AmutBmut pab1-1]|nr:other/FunK1 protein kinase [Coprinopsis cinerea AmutBmut pab1-1]